MQKKVKIIVLLCCMIFLAGASIVYVTFQKSYDELVEQIYTDISEIKLSKAYLEYKKAVRMNPERTEAYEAYAALLMVKGDYEQVQQVLTDALKTARKRYRQDVLWGEDIVRISSQLAGYYVQWNRTEEALALLREIPEEFKNDGILEQIEFFAGKKVLLLLDYEIEWKDAYMEAAVRKLLNKPEGEIMASEVWDITSLEIWGEEVSATQNPVSDYDRSGFFVSGNYSEKKGKIQSLEDLKHFENLESLSINFQEKLSLDFFSEKQLSRLRKISFVNDGITEIQPLMWQNLLTTVTLDYNSISEFMWLSRMERLNELSVRGNAAFWSMEDLDGMGRLRSLNILEIPEADFEKIAKIKSLEELQMDFKADFTALENCAGLRKLTITADEETLLYLAKTPKLYELNITVEDAAELYELEELGYLRKIILKNNGTKPVDLQVLAKLPDLEEVTLCGGEFSDYAVLSACKKLRKVFLPPKNEELYAEIRKYIPQEIIGISTAGNH